MFRRVFATSASLGRLFLRTPAACDLRPPPDDLAFVDRLLGFSAAVALGFERETGRARAAHLRRCTFIGLAFYNVYSLCDVLLRPDLMVISIAFRLMVMTPLCLGLAWAVSRVSAVMRERLVTIGMLAAVAQPILVLYLTKSPLGGYSFVEVPLTLVFGALLVQLRFPHAVFVTSAAATMMLVCLVTKPGLSPELIQVLAMHIVTNAVFVLYGNYQIEHARRSAYLSTLREMRRWNALEADRRQFATLSTTDPLTGLANRRALEDFFLDWNATPPNTREPIGLMMIDVDYFKAFNDTYGHPAGDACLVAVAHAIAQQAQPGRDLAVRYGGEEFVVVWAGRDPEALGSFADRLRAAVEELAIPHRTRGDALAAVTASLGAAMTWGESGLTAQAVLAVADGALYEAKRHGRNRCVVRRPEQTRFLAAPSDRAA